MLKKLDQGSQRRILDYLQEIAPLVDPRTRGKSLTGNHAGEWRYRVGDYWIIVQIMDSQLTILAVIAGHRASMS
jgi:mRNA interferase RelE/StbE